MELLKIKNLSVHFGDPKTPFRTVDRISYQIKAGEVVGLVGESDSGKSVSLLVIMGLIDDRGHVIAGTLAFDGRDLLKMTEKKRCQLIGAEVAMIFQDPMTSSYPLFYHWLSDYRNAKNSSGWKPPYPLSTGYRFINQGRYT